MPVAPVPVTATAKAFLPVACDRTAAAGCDGARGAIALTHQTV